MPDRETQLQLKLRSLASEAVSLADLLSTIADKDRAYAIGWGVLAINGWASDVRDEAMKAQKAAKS